MTPIIREIVFWASIDISLTNGVDRDGPRTRRRPPASPWACAARASGAIWCWRSCASSSSSRSASAATCRSSSRASSSAAISFSLWPARRSWVALSSSSMCARPSSSATSSAPGLDLLELPVHVRVGERRRLELLREPSARSTASWSSTCVRAPARSRSARSVCATSSAPGLLERGPEPGDLGGERAPLRPVPLGVLRRRPDLLLARGQIPCSVAIRSWAAWSSTRALQVDGARFGLGPCGLEVGAGRRRPLARFASALGRGGHRARDLGPRLGELDRVPGLRLRELDLGPPGGSAPSPRARPRARSAPPRARRACCRARPSRPGPRRSARSRAAPRSGAPASSARASSSSVRAPRSSFSIAYVASFAWSVSSCAASSSSWSSRERSACRWIASSSCIVIDSCVCAPSSSARSPIASASACFSSSSLRPDPASRRTRSSPAIRSRSVVTLCSRCSSERRAARP